MKYLNKIIYRTAQQLGVLTHQQGTAVLVYHSVSKRNDMYAVAPKVLLQQVDSIKKSSLPFISLNQLLSIHESNEIRNGVSVTFDDGYKDILSVIPSLLEKQIPVSVFVLSRPGKANRTELENNQPLLTKKDIQWLSNQGVTIGVHSATHPDFWQMNIDTIYEEVSVAKDEIEQIIGKKILYFAYPKGRYTPDVVQAVRYADYSAAFGVNHAVVTKKSDRFTLPRIIIDRSYDVSTLPLRISPGVQAIRRITNGNPWRYSL